MEGNHDSILVSAMLENYEESLDISLIDSNPYLHKNQINTTMANNIKGSHLTERTPSFPPTTNAKTLQNGKVYMMYHGLRFLYVNGIRCS